MGRSPCFPIRRRIDRFLCVVALIGIALLPVEYRGGADTPHAHASLQLWWDTAHGSTRHHPWPGTMSRTPDNDARASASAIVPEGNLDSPTVSKLTTAIEYPAIVTVLPLLFCLALRVPRAWSVSPLRVGRFPAPETPPPRSLLATL